METYRQDLYAQAGIADPFVQHNHSGSRQGVLRGLHYQIRQAQGKLIHVITGEIYDVAVDLRRFSPFFGRWVGVTLSSQAREFLWVPPGFAHGFYVLSPWADVSYKVTRYYAAAWDRTLLWNDPEIGIEWPLIDGEPPELSAKDRQGVPLREAAIYDWLR